MSVDHRITTTIESFKGLEKRRSDLIDKPGYFNEFKNVAFRASGAINKRKGFHKIISNVPSPGENLIENELGIASYTPKNELLVMNKNLKKINEETLTITNNSTTDDVIASFLPNEDNKLEYIFRSRSTKASVSIGTGEETTANPDEVISTLENTSSAVPPKDKAFNYYISSSSDSYTQFWETTDNPFSSLDFSNGFTFSFSGDNLPLKTNATGITLFSVDTTVGSLNVSFRINKLEITVTTPANGTKEYSINVDFLLNQSVENFSEIYTKFIISIKSDTLSYTISRFNDTKLSTVNTVSLLGTSQPSNFFTDMDFSLGTLNKVIFLQDHEYSTQFYFPLSPLTTKRCTIESLSVSQGYKELYPIIPVHNSSEGFVEGNLVGIDLSKVGYNSIFYFGNGSHDYINTSDPQNRLVNVYSHNNNQATTLNLISKYNYTTTDAPTNFPNQMSLFTDFTSFYSLYTVTNKRYVSGYMTPNIDFTKFMGAYHNWTMSFWCKVGSDFYLGQEVTVPSLNNARNDVAIYMQWYNGGTSNSRLQWFINPLGTTLPVSNGGAPTNNPTYGGYYSIPSAYADIFNDTNQFVNVVISNSFTPDATNPNGGTSVIHITVTDRLGRELNNFFVNRTVDLSKLVNFTSWNKPGTYISLGWGSIDELVASDKVIDHSSFRTLVNGEYVPSNLIETPVDGQLAYYRFGDNEGDGKQNQLYSYTRKYFYSVNTVPSTTSQFNFPSSLEWVDWLWQSSDTADTIIQAIDPDSNINLDEGELFSTKEIQVGQENYFNDEAITTSIDTSTTTITSPYMLDNVINDINNFTHVDLTAVASDTNSGSTTPSAFVIPLDKTIIPKGESITLRYFTEESITKGDSTYDYFEALHQKFVNKDNDFQNVSHTILNNNIYFATGFDEICKYDGNKLYRAGLPTPANITAIAKNTDTSSSNVGVDEDNDPNTNSYYMITYTHEDDNGNVIQSTQSATAKLTGNTGHNQGHRHLVEVTIPTVQPGTGFNLDDIDILLWRSPNTTTEDVLAASSFYKVNNTLKTVTISATVWQTAIGDPNAYSDYVNVTVNKPNPFDNTTWIYILRNNVINNDKSVTNVKYLDFLSDEEINLNDFITTSDYAEGRHDLPPKCAFITNHQGCLILAGTSENPNELFYSLPEFNFITGEIGSEYFPNNANSVIMSGANGTNITGVKTLRETLMIFNKNSVSVLSGDITTTGVQYLKKDSLTAQGEQGTLSSNCLQEWEGTLTFLSDEGILSTNTNLSYPTELSEPVKPLFLNKQFDRKRAISFFTPEQDVIGFYLPVQDSNIMDKVGSEGIFNSSFLSKLFVYDVNVSGWIEWTNIDMSGGVARHSGDTFFISRVDGKITLNIFKTASDKSSYSDFNIPIESKMITAWDALGQSSQFKKYIRLKVFTSDSNQAFEGTTFKLKLYLRSNFDNKDIGPIELNPGVFAGWGIANWGEFAWGSRDFKGINTKLFGKSKAIALHFVNNTINENILMSGYAMEVAAPFKTEIKE